MGELAPTEHLQPCLLDRLTDDEPEVKKESRDQRITSVLLNSKAHPFGDNIYEFSEAARSVLNYGIPDLCGATISAINPGEFEAQVKEAILNFESRISRKQFSVHIISPLDSQYIRTISFEIEGELWAQPLPDHLYVKTEVDLETGHHKLKGESGG
jgi:type VI secretion system protein ImpF